MIKFPLILQHTKRLSSPEEEYNWSRSNNLENQKSKAHNEGKTRKDQANTFEEIIPNKQKQKFIHGTQLINLNILQLTYSINYFIFQLVMHDFKNIIFELIIFSISIIPSHLVMHDF